MVSARLDALVKEPFERTYLAGDHGYWADLVLVEFKFLEERGGRLDVVVFHQKGDYITYRGPWGSVTLEFTPDNYPGGPWIAARAALHGRADFAGDLYRLAAERQPAMALPPTVPLGRSTIASTIGFWAESLRSSPDLF